MVHVFLILTFLFTNISRADDGASTYNGWASSGCEHQRDDVIADLVGYNFGDQVDSWEKNNPKFELVSTHLGGKSFDKRFNPAMPMRVCCGTWPPTWDCTTGSAFFTISYLPKEGAFDAGDCINYFWEKHTKLGKKFAETMCTDHQSFVVDASRGYSQCISEYKDQDINSFISSCRSQFTTEINHRMDQEREKKRLVDIETTKQTSTFQYLGESASVYSDPDQKLFIYQLNSKKLIDLQLSGKSPIARVLTGRKNRTQGYIIGAINTQGCFQYLEVSSKGSFSNWQSLPGLNLSEGCHADSVSDIAWLDGERFQVDLLKQGQKNRFTVRSGLASPLNAMEQVLQNHPVALNELYLMPNVIEDQKNGDLFALSCVNDSQDKECSRVQPVYFSALTQKYYPFGKIVTPETLNVKSASKVVSHHKFQKLLTSFLP